MDVESAGCWGGRMVAEEGKTRATDFSIAAIMARSAAEPRSPAAREPRSPPHIGEIGLTLTCMYLCSLGTLYHNVGTVFAT